MEIVGYCPSHKRLNNYAFHFRDRTSTLKLFNKLDKDKSGSLDRKEMAAGLKKIIKQRKGASAEVPDKIFQKIDHDGSDKISLPEFVMWFES